MNAKLPDYCYGLVPSTEEIIIIKKGIAGYFPSHATKVGTEDIPMTPKQIVDELNKQIHVTKAQAEAMMMGSMFGWDVPGADPDNYDQDGRYVHLVRNDTPHHCLRILMRREGDKYNDIGETMTVRELISELRQYPQDIPVILSLDDGRTVGGLTDFDISEEDKM